MSAPPLVYAGIGSRNTPEYIIRFMRQFGFQMARHNWMLRSGGAHGADQAFEDGVRKYISHLKVTDTRGHYAKEPHGMMAIYCANYPGGKNRPKEYIVPEEDSLPDASYYTKNFHPAPYKLSGFARKLMNRNAYQILGSNLCTPVRLVICWTEDGDRENPAGGTGQAVRIAARYKIPVYNLGNSEDYEKMWLKLKWMKEN